MFMFLIMSDRYGLNRRIEEDFDKGGAAKRLKWVNIPITKLPRNNGSLKVFARRS